MSTIGREWIIGCCILGASAIGHAELTIDIPPEVKTTKPEIRKPVRPSPKEPTGPLRLGIDLTDGSRIIGAPNIESLPVHTSFAKTTIPLKRVQSFTMREDLETATVELLNGDRLTGALDLSDIGLETLFGNVEIQMPHIRTVSVIPSSAKGGLLLHYTFDNDKEGRVIDRSGQKNDGVARGVRYEESPFGKAIRTSSRDTYVSCNTEGLSLDGVRQLTVSLWFKKDAYTSYGRIFNRGSAAPKVGGFGISVGGYYGNREMQSSFGVRLSDTHFAAVKIGTFAKLNEWYHIAGVYDGTKVKYFVNGELAASADVPHDLRHKPIFEQPDVDLFLGKCSHRRTWHDTHLNGLIDEVRIYQRALVPGEIKHLARK